MKIFEIEHLTNITEEKLGDLYWDLIRNTEKEIKNKEVTIPVDSILTKICRSNNIDNSLFKLHIIESNEINAFALPNKHIIIYSGLIAEAENEAVLNGVICHEIAHSELNHIMKRLIKEFGLSALISITTGNNDIQIIKEAVKLLSSTAYDRNLEREADIKAVEYLENSNIDPEPFADFLYRLGENESVSMKYTSWLSTHPDSKERAEYIIDCMNKENEYSRPVLSLTTWNELREHLTEYTRVSELE